MIGLPTIGSLANMGPTSIVLYHILIMVPLTHTVVPPEVSEGPAFQLPPSIAIGSRQPDGIGNVRVTGNSDAST